MTAEYIACASGSLASDGDKSLANCLVEETKRQEVRMALSLTAALARLTTRGRTALETSQRRWLTERDAECRVDQNVAIMLGPELAEVSVASCDVRRTAFRAEYLRTLR